MKPKMKEVEQEQAVAQRFNRLLRLNFMKERAVGTKAISTFVPFAFYIQGLYAGLRSPLLLFLGKKT
jgi:hypothetical protein